MQNKYDLEESAEAAMLWNAPDRYVLALIREALRSLFSQTNPNLHTQRRFMSSHSVFSP